MTDNEDDERLESMAAELVDMARPSAEGAQRLGGQLPLGTICSVHPNFDPQRGIDIYPARKLDGSVPGHTLLASGTRVRVIQSEPFTTTVHVLSGPLSGEVGHVHTVNLKPELPL